MISWTTPDQERTFHVVRVKAVPDLNAVSESVIHDMAVLDAKSAALLSFISVVIAGLVFSLGLVDGRAPDARLIRGGICLFLALFVYAAWLDLRCLHVLGPKSFTEKTSGDDFERSSIYEISTRRNKFTLALFICEASFKLLIPFLLLWVLVTYRVISI